MRAVDPNWRAMLVDLLGIGTRLRHRPTELSGGQQQRVAVARALVSRPAVVFADEPTAELDRDWRSVVMELLRDAADAGVAVVLATHDDEVAQACDGGAHLVDGVTDSTW